MNLFEHSILSFLTLCARFTTLFEHSILSFLTLCACFTTLFLTMSLYVIIPYAPVVPEAFLVLFSCFKYDWMLLFFAWPCYRFTEQKWRASRPRNSHTLAGHTQHDEEQNFPVF